MGLIALRYTYPGMSCFSSHNLQGETPLPNGAFGNCHNQSEWAILDWIVRPGLNRATDRMMVSLARLLACLFRSYSRRNNLEHWRNHIGSLNRKQCATMNSLRVYLRWPFVIRRNPVPRKRISSCAPTGSRSNGRTVVEGSRRMTCSVSWPRWTWTASTASGTATRPCPDGKPDKLPRAWNGFAPSGKPWNCRTMKLPG